MARSCDVTIRLLDLEEVRAALANAANERDAARVEAARLREAITKIADDVLWTREHVDPDDRETCAALPDLLLVIESDLRDALAAAGTKEE